MTALPPKLSEKALIKEAEIAAAEFRTGRLAVSDAWTQQYNEARAKFELLFEKLGDLKPECMQQPDLREAYSNDLSEALRYLAGPPISEDDLEIIAEVRTLSPGVLKSNPEMLRRVLAVIELIMDPHRFPWIKTGDAATKEQREAALVASAVLLAAQRIATGRRMEGKSGQEGAVIAYLKSLHYEEVRPSAIKTLVQGPKANQFCSECLLGERKADIVVRLHDTRLLAIECKVSNSELNSIKRINNDAAVKAQYWIKTFGTAQVVPAAMLSGVFKVTNLQQAQAQDLSLFWAHDLRRLGAFIKSTK
ncbi:MAG TPA: XamI family restriction endonuclease [Opitutaceae bacterium]